MRSPDADPGPSRVALIALVLALLVLVAHARVVLGGQTWDDVRYHTEVAPPRMAAADLAVTGLLPTWWDGSGLGVPLLGEPTHGAAYPGTWLAPSPRALDITWIAHLLVLALGVALWSRRLGATELASALAGIAIATTGIAVSSALRGALPALTWLPWVAWAASSIAARARERILVVTVLALALGGIGLSGQLGLLVDAIVIAVAFGARRGVLRDFVLAIGAGLAIAAIQWVPAAYVIVSSAGADVGALKLSRLLELVVPGSFGAAGARGIAQLAGDAPELPSLFVGAPVFAFAALSRPTWRASAVAVFLLGAALVVGRGGWPAWFGAPDLHLAVLAVLAAAHAGRGLDALIAGDDRRPLFALGGAAITTAIALGGLVALRSRAESPALDRALIDGMLGLACLGAAALLAWRARDESSRAASARLVAAVLAIAPIVGALGSTAPVTDRDGVETPSPWIAAARTAQPAKGPVRVYRPHSLFEDEAPESVPDAIATLTGVSGATHGIATAWSQDPARSQLTDRVWLAASGSGGTLLDRYGIAVAIVPASQVEGRRFVELARRGGWSLVRYPASPVAAMVTEWIWIDDDATAIARLFPPGVQRGLPPGLVVLRGRGPEHQDEPAPPEPCLVARWTPAAIDLTCTSQTPALAVLSSSASRGWTVHVDGKDTPWVIADLLRRAVPISEGAHLVSWRYEAPGLALGLLLAGLGVAALVAFAVFVIIRRRRTTRAPNERDAN